MYETVQSADNDQRTFKCLEDYNESQILRH